MRVLRTRWSWQRKFGRPDDRLPQPRSLSSSPEHPNRDLDEVPARLLAFRTNLDKLTATSESCVCIVPRNNYCALREWNVF